jgi:hypothetical protein
MLSPVHGSLRRVQAEFPLIQGRVKTLYASIKELQNNLDLRITSYNEKRPHHGRWCFAKTPMQTFLDAILIVREKNDRLKMISSKPTASENALSCQVKYKLLQLLFGDEARFIRINRPRPRWAPIGIRPEFPSQLIREYIYLYGAVSPKDRTCVYMITRRSDSQAFLNVLARKFARQDIFLFSTAPPTIAAATSRFPTISHCSSCHPIRQSSIPRKISGMKSAINLQELRPQINRRCARQIQAGDPLHRTQSRVITHPPCALGELLIQDSDESR